MGIMKEFTLTALGRGLGPMSSQCSPCAWCIRYMYLPLLQKSPLQQLNEHVPLTVPVHMSLDVFLERSQVTWSAQLLVFAVASPIPVL